uniref:Uncharacterized protein n=1 Tax=Romanomermis culicivorax TaxID=13658 RepID=A0A915HFX8_ROMCU
MYFYLSLAQAEVYISKRAFLPIAAAPCANHAGRSLVAGLFVMNRGASDAAAPLTAVVGIAEL